MNRPYWLDLVYVVGLFARPFLVAAVAANALSDWLGLRGWRQ
jgi:hypothetical protein